MITQSLYPGGVCCSSSACSASLIRRNAIILFLCIELMLNAVNLAFVALSRVGGIDGQIFVFFVMTVAAAEAAVGLAHHDLDLPARRDGRRGELQPAAVVAAAVHDRMHRAAGTHGGAWALRAVLLGPCCSPARVR